MQAMGAWHTVSMRTVRGHRALGHLGFCWLGIADGPSCVQQRTWPMRNLMCFCPRCKSFVQPHSRAPIGASWL